jgi:hypothetical protein
MVGNEQKENALVEHHYLPDNSLERAGWWKPA